MEPFTKTISGIDFTFQGILEGEDEVCRVSVAGQNNFRMIVADDGRWKILQQVPLWIKKLEPDLSNAIDEAYC